MSNVFFDLKNHVEPADNVDHLGDNIGIRTEIFYILCDNQRKIMFGAASTDDEIFSSPEFVKNILLELC